MAHPNEDLVRKGYDAFSRGDVETLASLFHPDAVWHTPGESQVSGDFAGIEAVLGYFGKSQELTGGTFRAELSDVVGGDQHAVGIHTSTGERNGRTLNDRNMLLFHVRDGKFDEVWQFSYDLRAFDEFFQ